MKLITIVLLAILLYVPLLSEGYSRMKTDLFEGQLYLSIAPLVGQKATLTLDLTPTLGDYGRTTVIFRVPDGVSILGQSIFVEPFLLKGSLKKYFVQIDVKEKGTYALQASVYSQVSQTRYEVEHFFVYLIVKDEYSQITEKVDSLTMSKKGIMVQSFLAPSDLTMAQGVLSFSGYIKYYNDNLLHLVPIKNVAIQLYEVNQLKNTLISTVYTNSEGFYSFDNIANPNMQSRSFQLAIVFNNNIINLVNDKSETYKFDLPIIQNVASGVFINDYIFNETNQFRCLGHIFNSVVEAGNFLLEKLNWSRKKINTKWPYTDGKTSLYTYTYRVPIGTIVTETLNIAVGKEWDRTTMLHEYGHSIMSALYDYNYNNLPKGTYKDTAHYINTVSDVEFAMKEGWAEYCEALFDDNAFNLTQYANAKTPNIEYNEWWKGKDLNNNKGEVVEGTVATILWDITDTPQSIDETPGIDDDEISFRLSELWNTMSKKKPKTIIDFWNHWQDNGYGQIEALYKIFADNRVNVTLKPQNRPPVANSQSISTNEDTAIDIVLTGTDEDSDPLTFRIVRQPSNGKLSGQLPNQRYTPNPNFFGQDSFDFVVNDGKVDSQPATVTIIVNAVNDPPVANPQSVSVDEDSQISITLTGTDPENDNLTYKIVSQPTNGSLSGNPPNVVYKPNKDFNGNDSFTFSVNDGQLDSQTARVNIKVNPVNDPPVVVDQSISVDEDSSVNILLMGTDADNDPLTFRIIKQPSNGTLEGQSPNYKYKPKQDFNGDDSFTFVANDGKADSNVGTVNIKVKPVNDPPIAIAQSLLTDENTPLEITLSGTDIDGDNLILRVVKQPTNGTLKGDPPKVTYNPKTNFSGEDSFEFVVNDGKVDSEPAKVNIKIRFVNDPPVAEGQVITINENTSVKIILSASDPNGDPITYKIVNQPLHGILTGNPPELTYKPDYGFGGEDSFTFVANDGSLDSVPANVKITVNLIPNPVDVNRDGIVNILDLVIIGKFFGKEDFPFDYNPDVNRDRKVDAKDLEIVKNNYGKKF